MTDTIVCKVTSGTYVVSGSSKSFYTTSKSHGRVLSPGNYTFFTTTLPAELADREVVSATMRVRMTGHTGARTLKLQRTSKPAAAWSAITSANDPLVLPGSTERSSGAITGTGVEMDVDIDVTADLAAIKAGSPLYGWRLATTYTTAPWILYGWQSLHPPVLIVELAEPGDPPEGLRPDGVTSLASPTLTWETASPITSARVQTDEVGGDFSSPVWTSAWVPTDIPQLLLSAVTGWTPLANNDAIQIRVAHDVTGFGQTGWSDPITITRKNYPTASGIAPTSTTHDPTPTAGWTFTPQVGYQVTVTSDGKTLEDTGFVAGSDSGWAPTKGATRSGQVLTYRIRLYDDQDRTAQPGDLGYVETIVSTTYTPGTGTAIDTLTATQDGVRPWVDLAWTRAAGTPDEWLVERDTGDGFETLARFDGLVGGSPVLSYRDWTCPPSKSVTYRVRPLTSGVSGASGPTATVRTAVTGAWCIDPVGGKWFRFGGQDLRMAQAESTVWFEPYGRQTPVKFTFALRGFEGGIGGTMKAYDGRTVEQYQADFDAIKSQPQLEVRLVWGDKNIPVVASQMRSDIHPELSTTEQIVKTIVLDDVRQSGEIPYPPVVP